MIGKIKKYKFKVDIFLSNYGNKKELDALNTSKQYENQDHIVVEESSESKLNGQMSFEMPIDEWEPKYCLCNRVSFGNMVACDNTKCRIEWFHFKCVGLTKTPKNKWYCPDCSKIFK